MKNDDTPDVEQIVARIRETLRAEHGDPSSQGVTSGNGLTTSGNGAVSSGLPSGPPSLAAEHEVAADIRTLHASHDLSRGRAPSHRRLLGPLIDAGRRAVERVLAPILAQQATYNAAACRVVSQAVARLDAIAAQGVRTARAVSAQDERADDLAERLAAQQVAVGPIRGELRTLQHGAAQLARESLARHVAREEQLSALELALADLRRARGAQHDRVAALSAQLEHCRDQIAVHQEQAARDREQLGAHQQQLATLQRTAADQQEEIAARRAGLRLQQDQLDRMARQVDDHERRIADVEPRLAALDDAVAQHGHGLATLGSHLQRQDEAVAGVRDGASARDEQIRAAHQLLRDELAHVDAAQKALVAGLRERVARTERRLRALANGGAGGRHDQGGGVSALPSAAERTRPDGLDYAGLEERFRGSEDEIRQRQRAYVGVFRGDGDVVDLGCGRGEFLELLRGAGIAGHGVDIDLDMILLCREKGLQVTHADAFAYLERVPDDSLGGVFAAQVIEHLEPRQLLDLVALIHRKLRPGGATVLETVNPECLATFATFYLDPTHVRPIPPGTLQFVLELADFTDVRITYTSPVDEALRIPRLEPGLFPDGPRFNASIDRLNELLFGCRDFAAIATKRALAPALPARAAG